MRKQKTASTQAGDMGSASDQIAAKVSELNDWRGQTPARVRALFTVTL